MITTLMAESQEEVKSLLVRVKEESGKAGLKLNTQKTKIMIPSPIISWQTDGEKNGKEVCQACILSLCLFNLYVEYIMQNSGLDEAQAEIKNAGRNINNLRYAHAAAAKSLQSCPTLCDPIDGSPPGSPVPGILQAGTLEWVAISFSNAGK